MSDKLLTQEELEAQIADATSAGFGVVRACIVEAGKVELLHVERTEVMRDPRDMLIEQLESKVVELQASLKEVELDARLFQSQIATAGRDAILDAACECVRDDCYFGIEQMNGCVYQDLIDYANSIGEVNDSSDSQ